MSLGLSRLGAAPLAVAVCLGAAAPAMAQSDVQVETLPELQIQTEPDAAEEALPGLDEIIDETVVDTVVLQGLDKITARVSTFDAPFDRPVQFGSLEITVRTCHKTPPEEPPERAVFLEIVDVRPDSPSVDLFTGWMFASSPALSAVEHPVYDVWVIDCKKASIPSSEVSEGN